MIMIRRFGIILTVLTLVFSFCAFSGIAVSEAALELDENEVYGLVQSADIEIPVFTAENMKLFDIPDNEALRFAKITE